MAKKSQDKRREEEQVLAGLLQERAHDEQLGEARRRDRRVSVAAARDALFLQRLEEVLGKVCRAKIIPSTFAIKNHDQGYDRILNIVLSDLHFRSLLDPREVPVQYGPVEEARRLAAVAVQTVEYKLQYRKNTILYVHLLGDIIQGQLHDKRDGAPLAEQSAAAIYLLSQLVGFFSQYFKRVIVRCTPGNHGRNVARHHDRAVHQKWDAIETIVYYAVKMAAACLPNVEVEIGYRPYYIADAFDQRGFYTHGDTVLNPGNPNKSIDVAGLEKQVNRLNAAEIHRGENPIDLFVVGHVHIGTQCNLSNGAIVLSNGPLVPPDPFAVSVGITEANCGQWLFESVKGHILGDSRFVTVDRETDLDRSLDKVIKPFRGF